MRVWKDLFGDGSKINAEEIVVKKIGSIFNLSQVCGQTGISVNGLNMNNVRHTGIYHGYDMTNGVASVGIISVFLVLAYSVDWVVQLQFPIRANDPGEVWIRKFYMGTTWGSWQKIF